MQHALFVKNGSGAGIGGLAPTWEAWVGIGGATSVTEPTVTASSTVPGLYTFEVNAVGVPIFGRLDFGSSVTDVAQRWRELTFDPADGTLTSTRAAKLDEITAARMGRLDNAGLDSLTAGRAANLDQVNSTRMGLIDGLTSTRTGNLDNIGGTRMTNLDGLTPTRTGHLDLLPAVPDGVWTYPMPPTPSAGTMADWVATTDERVWGFTIEGAILGDLLVSMAETVAGICDCVWNRLVTDAWNPNTMGWAVKVLMGVASKRNVALVGPDGTGSPTYDGDKLVAGRLRVYASKADTLTNSNPIFEVAVGSAYTGDNLTTFRVTDP